ncbi:MAG: phosphoribosylformylglycinamidine cyclo-ligase [Kiritimatiellia bacterium]
MGKKKSAYQAAGVDIDAKMISLRKAGRMVRATRTSGVLSDLGSFGGMFTAPGRDQVLIASTDGVGTKLKLASMLGRHDTVGQDLVNHCVNDILVHGATPLFFLDYFGVAGFDGRVFQDVVRGLCRACRANGCALLGGETAEMPGLYPQGEYDLVGTIIGSVPRSRLVTGRTIRAGDVLLGLPSTGLHTNGYSLARRIILEQARLSLDAPLPGTRQTIGRALLAVHRSYLRPVQALMKSVSVHGMAHITGGGFVDNVPRMLPDHLDAVIDARAWPVPPLFRFLQERGRVETEEMYRVFNMGIGLVVVVRAGDRERAVRSLTRHGQRSLLIGRIEKGHGRARVCF